MDVLSVLFFAVIGVGVLAAGFIAFKLFATSQAYEESGRQLEAQFEAEALQSVEAHSAAPRPALPAQALQAPPPPSPGPAAHAMQPAPAPYAAPSGPVAAATAEDAVAELVKRLRLLGIAAESEGSLALPMPPNGQILRLKRGGLLAVLPRLEGEAFMAHLCRRFDMVAFPTPHGEPMVIQRLQTRAAEMMPSLRE